MDEAIWHKLSSGSVQWFENFPCGRGCSHEEITGATAAGIVYGTPTHCGRGQVSEGVVRGFWGRNHSALWEWLKGEM